MTISRLEVFVQSVIVVCSVWIVMHNQAFSNQNFGYDFRAGIYNGHGWYKEWAVWPYQRLFRILPELEATFVWFGVSVLCYMVIAHYLCRVRYGWLLSLACMQAFWSHSANISPILAVYLLSPVTMGLAVLVKPFLFVPCIVVAFAYGYRSMAQRAPRNHSIDYGGT